jgi:hypothetical protein
MSTERFSLVEQALVDRREAISARLSFLEERAPVGEQVRRLRRIVSRLDAHIRLIRDLRTTGSR